MSRARFLAALVAFVSLVAVGCAGYDPAPDGLSDYWRHWINWARDNSHSDITHRALADYYVSDAELHESEEAYWECLMARWPYHERDGERFLIWFEERSEEMEQVYDYCEGVSGWADLQWIAIGVQENPRGLTGAQMIRECFEEHGVPDGGGLSDQGFEEMFFGAGRRVPESDAGLICLWDPTGADNLTIEQAREFERNAEWFTVDF